MDWRTGIRQAIEEFGHHRLRTLLTLLGMIFGVGAVISMLAIGEGAEREALQLIDSLGLRNVLIESVPQPEDRLKEIREDSLGLSLRDLEIALETLPQVTRHSALKKINVFSLFSATGRSTGEVLGVSPGYFSMTNLGLDRGRLVDTEDDARFAQVCVIGSQVARDLFGTEDPLGRRLKVNHVWLEVVGLVRDKLNTKDEFEGIRLGMPQNKIYLPLQTALKRFRFKPMEEELDGISMEVQDRGSVEFVAATLGRLLETRHHAINDYRLIVPEALLEQHRQTQRIFDIVMSSIAGISLLVGGIGIMNIMLATVLERTREIGIRRAIGAKRGDIRRQFLIEALTISLLGGVIGIMIGFGLAWGISTYSGWPFSWSVHAPLIAVTVCGLVGMGFGLYPAVKASHLDPIEALNRQI